MYHGVHRVFAQLRHASTQCDIKNSQVMLPHHNLSSSSPVLSSSPHLYTSPTLTLVPSSSPSSSTVMTTTTYTGVQWFGKWFCLDDVCQYTH